MNVCLYLFDKLFCLRRLKKSKKWPWLFSPFKLQFIFYLKTLTKRGKQWGWRCRGVGVGMGEKVNAVLYDKTTVLAQRHEIFVFLKNTTSISYTSICYPLISRLKRIQVGRGSNCKFYSNVNRSDRKQNLNPPFFVLQKKKIFS